MKIVYTYETITIPKTRVDVSYIIEPSGDIKVNVHYYGVEGLPSLPVFGMRFIFPTSAIKYCYKGLSGETYPDRMASGEKGIYEIEGLPVTKYLVPQDCGVHMETEWLEISRDSTLNNSDLSKEPFTLKFRKDTKNFAFSCLPYTSEQLENALHHEELPAPRRTVLCILGAVRGIGGIDSWGSDVCEEYIIDAQKDIEYSFIISII